jgi:DNA-binding transcriptional ArsR family regulator
MRRDVFQAIADPTRRTIISMIAKQSLSLNAVAEKFDMSRPAISRHIRILTECGLIHIESKGRERICQARLKKLSEVSAFADQYKVFWENKLEDLDQFLKNKKKKK